MKNQEYKNFNTFRFFEENYGRQNNDGISGLAMPEYKENNYFIFKLAVFLVMAGLFGFGLMPILTYVLKTPYPLVVVAQDVQRLDLRKNDLIFVRGVVSAKDIKPSDVVVYNADIDDSGMRVLSVGRVTGRNDGGLSVEIQGDAASVKEAAYRQVVGKAIGRETVFRLPWIGVFGGLFKKL